MTTSHSYGNGQNSTPPQNPNPSTAYNNFAQLITSMRQTRNSKLVQIGHEGASGQIREIYGLFFIFIFSPDLPTEVTHRLILPHNGSNYAEWRKDVPLWGPHDGRPHLGGQIPHKPFKKGGMVRQCLPSQRKIKISISSNRSNLFQWNFYTLMTLRNTQRG